VLYQGFVIKVDHVPLQNVTLHVGLHFDTNNTWKQSENTLEQPDECDAKIR